MSILNSNSPCESSMIDSYEKKCKPDYEGSIARLREKIAKAEDLLESIFNYTGNTRFSGKLAEMVGELVSEIRQFLNEIDRLIKAQEQDK